MSSIIGKTKLSVSTLLLVGLLVSVGGFSVSCGDGDSDVTTPPAGTPSPTPPLTTEWVPDGAIGASEYSGEETYGNYELYWRSDAQHIFVGIKVKTDGWVAVGIQPGSRMKNADMIFGFVEDGQTTVLDLFSTGDFGPHPPDAQLGGTNDIIDFGGKEEGEYTIIEFSRALVTDDEYDNPLSSGANKIIWSYGSSDEFDRQHSTRGYGELDL
jgi:hypothetical protein